MSARLPEVTPVHDPMVNDAVVRFLDKSQCSTFAELYDIFGDAGCGGVSVDSIKRFRSLLQRLVESGRICSTGKGFDRRYLPADPDAQPPQLVPPPQYNRMGAPTYVPDVCPAMRAGAMDFKQCASRGHQC